MKAICEAPSQINPPASRERHAFWKPRVRALFSFPVMCMFLLALPVFAIAVKAIPEPDIWWHLRNAQYLLQRHSFPVVDTFSFGAAGSPWLNHEWLAEIPFLLSYQTMGLRGLLALYFLLSALMFVGVYYRACRSGADCKSAAITTLVAILLGSVSIGPRPLLFGWLCMVALLMVLDHFRRTGKGLWVLPPLFTLWINFHGSWAFGLVVLVLMIASGLVEGEWGLIVARRWSSAELRKLLVAAGASVAALFVNPFGYKLVLYPFDLLFRQSTMMQHIQEWQPVNFSDAHGKLTMLVLFGLLAVLLLSRCRWRLDEVLLTGFALWAGLSHVRMLFFVGLVIAPIVARHFELLPPYDRKIDKPWLNAAIMTAIVTSLLWFFPSTAALQHKLDQEYPSAALAFMERQHINGRIFNSYGWGGYMEWHTPELKPFIDGRADIFVYNGTFDEYFWIIETRRPLELLDKFQIGYVLLKPEKNLNYVLEHSSAWRLIYTDKIAKLYARRNPTDNSGILN